MHGAATLEPNGGAAYLAQRTACAHGIDPRLTPATRQFSWLTDIVEALKFPHPISRWGGFFVLPPPNAAASDALHWRDGDTTLCKCRR